MATIFVDADGWEARAQSLGGTSNALVVGVAARLAQRVGRAAADGSIVVGMPVNERAPGDTRANAVGNVNVPVDDPALATTDLREIRAAVKQALIRRRETGDEEQAVNAIVPLLTQRILRGINARTVVPSNAVGSSNLGVVNPAVSRPDGTDADYFAIMNNFLRVSKAKMLRRGGMQSMVWGRACGQVFITVASYHPDRPNANDVLRQDLSSTLSDFSLTGTHL
jgi:diacylglycerol O-acyltransferase